MVRDIINANKVRWYEMENLGERDKEIQRIIMQLDEVAVEYEKKWGIGVLQKECSPQMLERWHKQGEKFQDAMMKSDVEKIRELSSGFKRAYKALEDDCISLGKKPKETDYMEHVVNDKHFIVCQTHDDVRIMLARQPDAEVWSMKEVANVICKHDLVTVLNSKPKTNNKDIDPFDFEIGDNVEM
jgi:hypothetical protein